MERKEFKVLVFTLDNENYAADIMDIERILEYVTPTIMPDLPLFIEGVINYEDRILPIVNLNKKFNMKSSERTRENKIIVVKDGDTKVGMIVDVVSEVRDINVSQVEKAPDIASKVSKRYIKGLIKNNEKLIIYLDLAKILSDDEKEALK
ncbi:chemotaxis protein CheW [Clostridium hydrogeniformans]|uniref:chemotaxis protein CheW n=1 Tax=Clostridium hydrogeniformans TaxID=349933 RepID=UPI000483D332|nr:chemotaxis protein CheW [Clostridium hydrogeniformans]